MATRDDRSRRPERVIILDADDPMTEVEGQIVWREAHERIVDEVRRQAYAEGHAAGVVQASTHVPHVRLSVRRRRTLRWWLRAAFLAGIALLALLFLPLLLT